MTARAYCDCHVNIWNDEHVLPLYTQQLARVRAGAGVVRVLKPGEAATMELNGGRLNLDVDARNRVTEVRCG